MAPSSTPDTDSMHSVWVAGADGCAEGWIVVLQNVELEMTRHRLVEDVEALLALPEDPAVLGVDMIIGCPDRAAPGGRSCDRAARRLLGPARGTSVFSPPAHEALSAHSFDDAQQRNRASGPDAPGLSKQTFHLFPKIRALADRMTPARQESVREVHPELAFYAMNDDSPLEASKHTDAGRTLRMELLARHDLGDVETVAESSPNGTYRPNDLLDAQAACWTARRIWNGTAERCPPRGKDAPRNDRGLRMEIWR